VYQHEYVTKKEAMASIEEYIESWYNTKRRHSSLGYVSPAEYERLTEKRLAGASNLFPLATVTEKPQLK